MDYAAYYLTPVTNELIPQVNFGSQRLQNRFHSYPCSRQLYLSLFLWESFHFLNQEKYKAFLDLFAERLLVDTDGHCSSFLESELYVDSTDSLAFVYSTIEKDIGYGIGDYKCFRDRQSDHLVQFHECKSGTATLHCVIHQQIQILPFPPLLRPESVDRC